MTIHIKPEIEKSIIEVVSQTGEQVDDFVNHVLEEIVDCYRNNPGHMAETISRLKEYRATGETITHEDVKKRMEAWKNK